MEFHIFEIQNFDNSNLCHCFVSESIFILFTGFVQIKLAILSRSSARLYECCTKYWPRFDKF